MSHLGTQRPRLHAPTRCSGSSPEFATRPPKRHVCDTAAGGQASAAPVHRALQCYCELGMVIGSLSGRVLPQWHSRSGTATGRCSAGHSVSTGVAETTCDRNNEGFGPRLQTAEPPIAAEGQMTGGRGTSGARGHGPRCTGDAVRSCKLKLQVVVGGWTRHGGARVLQSSTRTFVPQVAQAVSVGHDDGVDGVRGQSKARAARVRRVLPGDHVPVSALNDLHSARPSAPVRLVAAPAWAPPGRAPHSAPAPPLDIAVPAVVRPP